MARRFFIGNEPNCALRTSQEKLRKRTHKTVQLSINNVVRI